MPTSSTRTLWDFSNAALPYEAFFGPQLGYDGVQFKWVAPTELFLELGAEFGRARGFPASDGERNKNGLMSGSLFAHVGGDVGVANSWRAGASFFSQQAARPDLRRRGRHQHDGDQQLLRQEQHHGAGLRLEVGAGRQREGARLHLPERVVPPPGVGRPDLRHHGGEPGTADRCLPFDPDRLLCPGRLAVQACTGALGYRYDQLASADASVGLIDRGTLAAADLPILRDYTPKRQHGDGGLVALGILPHPSSSIARDQTRPGVTDDQVWVHYIMSMGAHGAHKY
jgi:hypothetical protein